MVPPVNLLWALAEKREAVLNLIYQQEQYAQHTILEKENLFPNHSRKLFIFDCVNIQGTATRSFVCATVFNIQFSWYKFPANSKACWFLHRILCVFQQYLDHIVQYSQYTFLLIFSIQGPRLKSSAFPQKKTSFQLNYWNKIIIKPSGSGSSAGQILFLEWPLASAGRCIKFNVL